jgi:hypothetical protein
MINNIYICTIIKNEQRHLDEWIKYHLDLGISQIWLFEDKGEPHNSITDKYGIKVKLIRLDKDLTEEEHKTLQQGVYQSFYEKIPVGSYSFFIDSDEFIVLKNNYTLNDLCIDMATAGYTDLPIFWKIFNANGHFERPDLPTFEAYTEQSEYIPYEFPLRHSSKTFAHKCDATKDSKFASIHHIIKRDEKEFQTIKNEFYHKVKLHHYYTRSYEDRCEKKMRGGFLETNRKTDETFFRFNPDMVEGFEDYKKRSQKSK